MDSQTASRTLPLVSPTAPESPRTSRSHLRLVNGSVVSATFVFSDMVSSTEIFERLGDRGAFRVMQTHNRIVREQLAVHRGREIGFFGDGFLMVFSSARRALLCAIGVQRGFASYNNRHPDHPIRLRLGLHNGEVIQDSGTLFGKALIIAARIMAQARGQEILVSSRLKRLLQGSRELQFGEGRTLELKGLGTLQRVYPVSC